LYYLSLTFERVIIITVVVVVILGLKNKLDKNMINKKNKTLKDL